MGFLKSAILATLSFSLIVLSIYGFTESAATSQGTVLNNEMNNSALGIVETIQNATNEFQDSLTNSQINIAYLDVPFLIVSSAYNVFKLATSLLLNVFTSIIAAVVSTLQLPDWFAPLAITALGIALVIGILSALMKWDI